MDYHNSLRLPLNSYLKKSFRTIAPHNNNKKIADDFLTKSSALVHPWGVEPQSMEPESIILSIELWVHFLFAGTKVQQFLFPS